MINAPIYLFSAPKHSGKTTRLMQMMEKEKNVYGIFSPVIDGRRYFMDAHTKEIFPMEANADESDTLSIGRFVFSAAGFRKAIAVLRRDVMQREGWLVIDEVGPLELLDQGFSKVIKEIFQTALKDLKIVLVVREELKHEVIEYFRIKDYQVLE